MGATKAHVRDRSDCEASGVRNHEYCNIIPLCANCHYVYFDDGRMGIVRKGNKYFFIILESNGQKRLMESLFTLNVIPEYILWKNRRCRPALHMILFDVETQEKFLNR
jgi:hypothetical protein